MSRTSFVVRRVTIGVLLSLAAVTLLYAAEDIHRWIQGKDPASPGLCPWQKKGNVPPLPPPSMEEISRNTADFWKGRGGETAVADFPANAASEAVPIENFIDEYIFGKMAEDGIPHAPLAGNATFVRRAYLDLTGRIPTVEALEGWLAQGEELDRGALIDSLIESDAFVDRFTQFFGDLYRSSARYQRFRGRNAFYAYIQDFLRKNRPYDEVVTEMLTASGPNWHDTLHSGSTNFLARQHNYNNRFFHYDQVDEITIAVFDAFLGMHIECISCHGGNDGIDRLKGINDFLWTKRREDFFQQSAFFAGVHMKPVPRYIFGALGVRIHENANEQYNPQGKHEGGDRPPRPGGPYPPVFLLDGTSEPGSLRTRRRDLARMITEHPQFARAIVNRLWAHFMVRGIVHPPDDFDLAHLDDQPSHPELLDALAQAFVESGYDLRRVIRLITTSSAYRLSSRFEGEWREAYAPYFARKFVRRLDAEEIHDSLLVALGVSVSYPVRGFRKDVNWAMQLPGPTEPRNDNYAWVREFLEIFGRGNRDTIPRSSVGSIPQALILMNHPLINDALLREEGTVHRLLSRIPEGEEDTLVEELYLAFLSRPPTPEERTTARDALAQDRVGGAENLAWALINNLAFLFNY